MQGLIDNVESIQYLIAELLLLVFPARGAGFLNTKDCRGLRIGAIEVVVAVVLVKVVVGKLSDWAEARLVVETSRDGFAFVGCFACSLRLVA